MKKSPNKWMCLALALVMVMTMFLTGCGSKNDDSGEVSGEITFCTWGSEEEIETDQKLVDTFMEQNPGTKVNLEVLNDDYQTAVETRMLGGKAPDVIYGHPKTFLPWAQQGRLMDLSDLYDSHEEWWNDDEWSTELYDSFKQEGKYIAVPNGADIFVLFYNKTMCDEANVGYPDETWTWDQLLEWGQKLTSKNADGTPKTFGFDSSEGDYYGLLAYIYANGGAMFDDVNNPQKVVFDTPENVQILKAFQDKVHKYHVIPEGEEWDYINDGFVSQEFASSVSGVYETVYLSEVEDFEWDMTLLPQAENGTTPALYAGYAVSADTKNPELAKKFVEYIMTEDAQSILAETGLITVANKKVANSDEILNFEGAPEHNKIRVDALKDAVNMDPALNSWQEMIDEVISPNIEKLEANKITPEDCAANIQKGLEKLLKEELESRED